MRNLAAPALALLFASVSPPALAEPGFAEPPGGVVLAADSARPEPEPFEEPERSLESSTVRIGVGPGLRVAKSATAGGLVTTLDAGSGPVGARVSGTWVRVGSDDGLSEYQGELWVDFGAGRRLHPILGAGAGVASIDHEAADGSVKASTYGVGVLRGTLEYVLPVEQADARAGVDVVGSVPAIHGRDAPDPGAWLVFVARVGVGF
jgi:hypothetical protein